MRLVDVGSVAVWRIAMAPEDPVGMTNVDVRAVFMAEHNRIVVRGHISVGVGAGTGVGMGSVVVGGVRVAGVVVRGDVVMGWRIFVRRNVGVSARRATRRRIAVRTVSMRHILARRRVDMRHVEMGRKVEMLAALTIVSAGRAAERQCDRHYPSRTQQLAA